MKDLDTKESLLVHKKIISSKLFLKRVYIDFYRILKQQTIPKNGLLIEVGSGGGFLKKIIPNIITTDVLKARGIDRKLDLENIKLKSNSVSAFYMLNVFHHIKNPKKALSEMERCLVDGGKIIMIEPWSTMWSKFIYQNFHNEEFNTNGGWKVNGFGRMSDANGALPWIVFERDINKFKKMFPSLNIQKVELHTPFKYLVSGNLSKPQLLPVSFYPIVDYFEKIISPLNKYLALFATIVVTKVDTHIKHD